MSHTQTHALASTPDRKKLTWFAVAAVIGAAAPHLFLSHPHELYRLGEQQAWIGMTVWAPAFLAAVALFFETGLRGHVVRPAVDAAARTAAAVLVPMVVTAVLVSLRHTPDWIPATWLRSLVPAMALYGFVHAVEALFWQGFVQSRVLGAEAAAPGAEAGATLVRVLTVTVGTALVWLPFAQSTGLEAALGGYVLDAALIGLATAALFELGIETRWCMLARGAMGAGLAWAYMNVFI